MGTLYTLITGFSIVGIKIVDVILSFIFDSVAFAIAWKIGGLGASSSERSLLHWISRIGVYAFLLLITQKII